MVTTKAGKDEGTQKSKTGNKGGGAKYDPYIGSRLVTGLNKSQFLPFLENKDAALVMFYDPKEQDCEWSKPHFIRAAKRTERPNHAYAAVDCAKEIDLCAEEIEETTHYPVFKLYSRGKVFDTYRDSRNFHHFLMRNFVENVPLLEDPAPPKCGAAGKPCLRDVVEYEF